MLRGPQGSSSVLEEEGPGEAEAREALETLTHGGRFLINALASEPHFVDHLFWVWRQIPPERRGVFYCGGATGIYLDSHRRAAQLGITETCAGTPGRRSFGVTMVASSGDLMRVVKNAPAMRVAMFEHGCGYTYNVRQKSYAGSADRPNVDLFVFPNEISANRQRDVHPDREIVVIGSSPKLDRYVGRPLPDPAPKRPLVVTSWHWPCNVVPETRSALGEYRHHLGSILGHEWDVAGHAHPRMWGPPKGYAAEVYKAWGIPTIATFDEVMERASCYVIDTSSTLYEFAATNRPVVVINSRHYRRGVSHGLRFWDHIPGLQCDDPKDLAGVIRRALEDPPEAVKARREALAHVYPHNDGHSAERAAQAVLALHAKASETHGPPPQWRPPVTWEVVVAGAVIDEFIVRREAQVLAAKRGGKVVRRTSEE